MAGLGFENILLDCETLVRESRLTEAATTLRRVKLTQVPRHLRRKLASLARRTGQIDLGLKLLTPLVRDETGRHRADFAELAEYAILLQRTGAVHEALQILSGIQGTQCPEADLYTAFALFNIWEYDRALVHLERYLAGELSDYARCVAEVNRGAALIAVGRLGPALHSVCKNLEHARVHGYVRVAANCHEMLAQIYVHSGDLTQARREINAAAGLLGESRTLDQLFVLKWKAVIEARERATPEPLLALQSEAHRRGHFETVRDCDFHLLALNFDSHRFDHLYFGSPYIPYRAALCERFNARPQSDTFLWGNVGAKPLSLDGEGQTFKLLRLLTRDLYRPAGLGHLFSGLYPTEQFNIYSSPGRVHQTLRRARKDFEKWSYPLEIVSGPAGYQLQINGAACIVLRSAPEPSSELVKHLKALNSSYAAETAFTAREARDKLGLSAAAFRRFANWAIERGDLKTYGAGPATVYLLKAAA